MSVLETAFFGAIRDAVRDVVREELAAASSQWKGCVKLADAAKLAGGVSVSTIEKWGREGLDIHKRGHVRVVEIDQLRDFLRRREVAKPDADAEWLKSTMASVTQMRRVR
jgi:hypothetical protein